VTGEREVTFGVPVYRGHEFVADTLRTIQAQTFRDFRVLISVDGPDPASEAACRPFLADPRFSVEVQPENLGWIGNINWLMERTETPFWCYQQQDDLLDPRYLETLLGHADEAPEAAVVYCDLAAFGTEEARLIQPTVTGAPFARQLSLLLEHHTAVAFRGLTRVHALRYSGGVRDNAADGFAAELGWCAAAARSGELHRVPETLYRKRFHEGGESASWFRWPEDRRAHAWVVHCADMLEQALSLDVESHVHRMLWAAAAGRVVAPHRYPRFLPSYDTAKGHRTLLDLYLRHLRRDRAMDYPKLLGARWRQLYRWARELSAP